MQRIHFDIFSCITTKKVKNNFGLKCTFMSLCRLKINTVKLGYNKQLGTGWNCSLKQGWFMKQNDQLGLKYLFVITEFVITEFRRIIFTKSHCSGSGKNPLFSGHLKSEKKIKVKVLNWIEWFHFQNNSFKDNNNIFVCESWKTVWSQSNGGTIKLSTLKYKVYNIVCSRRFGKWNFR